MERIPSVIINVMIVDDSAFMRLILNKIVTKAGYHVICEASNGREAIRKYKESNPQVVLLDITMPDVNGLEVLRHIKDYDQGAKVIMCSSLGNRFIIMEALQLGAADFIVKPPEEKFVLKAIQKAIN
jgi:two-component system chemotaxis response regulator CheY